MIKSDIFSKLTSFYPFIVSILLEEKMLLFTSIVSVIISIIYTIIRIIVYLRFNRGKLTQDELDLLLGELDEEMKKLEMSKNKIERSIKNDR